MPVGSSGLFGFLWDGLKFVHVNIGLIFYHGVPNAKIKG